MDQHVPPSADSTHPWFQYRHGKGCRHCRIDGVSSLPEDLAADPGSVKVLADNHAVLRPVGTGSRVALLGAGKAAEEQEENRCAANCFHRFKGESLLPGGINVSDSGYRKSARITLNSSLARCTRVLTVPRVRPSSPAIAW